MSEPFPHEAIREAGERSYTAALLAALGEAEGEAREAIAETLGHLRDPRAIAPLTALLEDRSRPQPLRERVAQLLGSAYDQPGSAAVRRWWREGDAILRTHALRWMDARHADVVEAVAADPDHPHHAIAIGAMTGGFEAPRHQAIKLAALGHPDAQVRVEAAEALAVDRPVAAEAGLILATRDPAPEVAAAAATALGGYATRASVAALAALRDQDTASRDAALAALTEIADDIRAAIAEGDEAIHRAIRRWVAPVVGPLGLRPRDLAPPRLNFQVAPNQLTLGPPQEEPDPTDPADPPPEDVWRRIHDPNTPRAELRALLPWTLSAVDDPQERARRLAGHADPEVRRWASWCFHFLGDRDGLVGQLTDPSDTVRDGAAMALANIDGPDPVIEAALWPVVADPTAYFNHVIPALSTWCIHASPDRAAGRLTELVRRDHRDPVRAHAVAALVGIGAVDAVDALLPLLAEPPRVTWHVHLALLGAAHAIGREPPGLDVLREVDDLHVQAAIAPWQDDGWSH